MSRFRTTRILTDAQSAILSKVALSINRNENDLKKWFESIKDDLFMQIEKIHNSMCHDNSNLGDWISNRTREITISLNYNTDIKQKSIINNIWKFWENLVEYIINYFSYIDENFSCNITRDNINDVTDWIHNKSMLVEQKLHSEQYNGDNKMLNDTVSTWKQAIKSIENFIIKPYINSTELNGYTEYKSNLLDTSTPLSTHALSTTSDSLSLLNTSTTSSEHILSTESDVLSTIASTITNTLSYISENISTVTPTNVLDVLSTFSPSITENLTKDINDLNISSFEKEDNEFSACLGFFCGSTVTIGLSVSLAVVGAVFLFVLFYKYVPMGSLFGKKKFKIKKGKKKLREISLEDLEDTFENSKKIEKVIGKRSRLNSFLRAFGYRYRSTFSYIDEGIPIDERIV
ncbi:PIR-like protein [Plasmodium relictum]|uniref:PIR-like protein n=1 Tax=Plasmodium relictum TaxID=85471 RepID=A0A1J1GKK5_PLARL|nr:PIR-like protein [Plasmodium relictum]CRG85265.1 PIR-like protein [Plasmodium relictum]